ncbi:reverse transcriptase domain-containing protein, partial [Tanacetum coccineum]
MTFTCMPFGLCNAPGTFQRCMMAIFYDMIEKTMEVFMDDFSVFGDSFDSCLSNLEQMLKKCEDTNLVLNWEKCHFMCKEGIVLGHKISKSGIEVDRAKVDSKAITTRSGVAYEGPSNPTKPSPKKVVERETGEITDEEQNEFQGSTAQIPPSVIPKPIPEPEILKTLPKSTPIPEPEIPKTVPKPSISYPSRRDNQKNQEKASYQKEKICQMFQDLRFDISFVDALFLMPRFASTIRDLLMNKEKLLELVKIPLNENCSAMLLKKLPKKLGDP